MSRGWPGRVGCMEFSNQVAGMGEIGGRFPRVVVRPISYPADKVEEQITVAAIDFAVEDLFDFIFDIFFNFDQGRRWLDPIWDCVANVGLQAVDVEHVMDLHGRRKPEAYRLSDI
ncbi:uncharacterized protein UHOD_20513 [Ustilago sp. UG-2017b]|nr:uncharacterized protein UHOD_20513 [Ustilago sp. UG-2017b]